MRFCLFLYLLMFPLSAQAGKNQQVNLMLNPAASWAYSYLVNSVLSSEYLSVMQQTVLNHQTRDEFLRSPHAIDLWKRANFSLSSAKLKSQRIPNAKQILAFMKIHSDKLAANPTLKPTLSKFSFLGNHEQLSSVMGEIKTTFDKSMSVYWEDLKQAYNAPTPSCPLEYEDVKMFSEHQKTLFANGQSPNPSELLRPIMNWDKSKIQCLVFIMIAAPEEAKKSEGFEPLNLFRAMQQISSPLSKDTCIRTMYAIRLLQLNQYAETLRILVELQDSYRSIRLPYEIVQIIYSYKQKGKGAVALRGL